MISARQLVVALSVFSLLCCGTVIHAQSSVRMRPGSYAGAPGSSVTVPIEISSDVAVTGFSFGVSHTGAVSLSEVTRSGRFTSILGGAPDSDFYVVDETPSGGSGFIVAAILPPGDGAPVIPAGTTHIFDVTYSIDDDAEGSASVLFTDGLRTEAGAPPVDLVVDTDSGTSRSFTASGIEIEFSEGFLRGDADLSGSRSGNFSTALTVTDAVIVLQHLFSGGPPPPCLDAADADDSGSITVTDTLVVLNFLFRNGIAPAAPFPNPGVDPSPDGIGCVGLGI